MKSIKQKLHIPILVVLLYACSFTYEQKHGEVLDAPTFKKMLEEKPGTLIDVRTPDEFSEERIYEAFNIDVQDEEFITQIRLLKKNETFYLYCGVGKRSEVAMEKMVKEGFLHVYSLRGGLEAWKKEGYPTIRPVLEIGKARK